MTTPYLQEKGIDTYWNQPSAEELLNASKKPEPWTPNTYSNDPDYTEVEPELFEYLHETQDFYKRRGEIQL